MYLQHRMTFMKKNYYTHARMLLEICFYQVRIKSIYTAGLESVLLYIRLIIFGFYQFSLKKTLDFCKGWNGLKIWILCS